MPCGYLSLSPPPPTSSLYVESTVLVTMVSAISTSLVASSSHRIKKKLRGVSKDSIYNSEVESSVPGVPRKNAFGHGLHAFEHEDLPREVEAVQ